MSKLRRMKRQYMREQERKKKKQKAIFVGFFCVTVLISLVMLTICAIHQEMLLWAEVVITVTWGVFTISFAYGIKSKWWFFSEPHYSARVGWVDKRAAWEASIVELVLSGILFSCCFIHLLVRLLL